MIDFTKPFQDLGNLILVAKESAQQSLFAFMDPFSMRLWLVVGGAYILCGLVTTLVSWLSPFGKRGAFSSSPDTVRDKYKPDRNVFNLWNSLWHTFSMWSTQVSEATRQMPNRLLLSFLPFMFSIGVAMMECTEFCRLFSGSRGRA